MSPSALRFRTWPVAALGLGGLLLLVVLSLLTATRRTQGIYDSLDRVNAHHRDIEARLRRLRSDVHVSGIFVRDYLLDQERERAPEYRQTLAEYWETTLTNLAELQRLAGEQLGDDRIASLQERLVEYWQQLEPLFDWTPTEKLTRSASFLRREVVPRREAVLEIAREIEELNNANLATQREEVTARYAAFRQDLTSLVWQSLLLGTFVALSAVIRLRMLEGRSEKQRVAAKHAEDELRRLSRQLVATQEDERRNLSRELHDHVGQMLTALRMELGVIERVTAGDPPHRRAVLECKSVVDDVMRTVRDLALGLRPSMLDDLGLQAALEWHIRDFNRRYGSRAHLAVDGTLSAVPDPHRTCIYRVVQEALTNCARHSRANTIDVSVTERAGRVDVAIVDDGVGFDPSRVGRGLGLRGIEERVRELGGQTQIETAPGSGTRVRLSLAVPDSHESFVDDARAAS